MNEASPSPLFSRWHGLFAPVVILVAAICYYGSYIQYWFNPHDEGGTAAFIAMRLLSGEAPFKDVELGYNVGWFWPIVGLFKVAGVNFLLMRGYFFALSTLAAVCGWAIVHRSTGNQWLALAVGLVLVVFPGSQFKNYIPLVCLANALGLIHVASRMSDAGGAFLRGIGIGGIILGITLLIRIDIGLLCAVMWVGLIILRLFDARFPFSARWYQVLGGCVIFPAAILLTHIPAIAAASAGGYTSEFGKQYSDRTKFLEREAGALVVADGVGNKKEGGPPMTPRPKRKSGQKPDRTTLPRVNWATFTSFSSDKSALFILTYLPVAIYALLVIWASFGVFRSILRTTFTIDQNSMLALLLLGTSLTTFPQFFFFRPDRPHLSEFMPGYIAAAVGTAWLLPGLLRAIAGVLIAGQLVLFGWFALDHYSAGTIAARNTIKKSKRILFQGANGVRVFVHQKTYDELETIRKAVAEHSRSGEWLVCYPYQPGYNVMTDRPSYERELYNDNATAPREWSEDTIGKLEEKKPAVVIIDDRAINQVDASRFSKWAAPVYKYVKRSYGLVGKVDTVEIYSRDTAPPTEAPAEEEPKKQ